MNIVSVVIPTKNRQTVLAQVLPTYLSQKEVGEVVIVNDGSSDETSPYLKKLAKTEKKITLIENKTSMGAPFSRNIGINQAKFDYIFFGEDDLYLKENTFKVLFAHLEKTNADIISGRRISLAIHETEQMALDRASKDFDPLIYPKLITSDCQTNYFSEDVPSSLLDASMLIKKKILLEVPYDTYFKKNAYREETDFQLSAREHGYTLIFCPHIATFHLPKKIKDEFHLTLAEHMLYFVPFRIITRNFLPFIAKTIRGK